MNEFLGVDKERREIVERIMMWLKYDPCQESQNEVLKKKKELDRLTGELEVKKRQKGIGQNTDGKSIEQITKSLQELKMDLKKMMKQILFGTAGLRSKMGAGFANMNDYTIIRTTIALCKYLMIESAESMEKRGCKQEVVIGFDHRCKGSVYSGRRFAVLATRVFLSYGFIVHLFSDVVPTPYVPFAVLKLKACAGIMITASHNPAEDNGYKLYWSNGCQITRPHDNNISKLILSSQTDEIPKCIKSLYLHPQSSFSIPLLFEKEKRVFDPLKTIPSEYHKSIVVQTLQFRHPSQKEKKTNPIIYVSYSAMYGTGLNPTLSALQAFGLPSSTPHFRVLQRQKDPNPTFPDGNPNPEHRPALKFLEDKGKSLNPPSNLIFAQDPDADRLAVGELEKNSGVYYVFAGDEIGILLIYLMAKAYSRGKDIDLSRFVVVVSTVSSARRVRKIVEGLGMKFGEVLTGFKWIGSYAHWICENKEKGMKLLVGYEEANGFCLGNVSYDKDGIRTLCVFYELAEQWYRENEGKSLKGLLGDIMNEFGAFYQTEKGSFMAENEKQKNSVYETLRNWKKEGQRVIVDYENGNRYPGTLGNCEVLYIRDLTTGFNNEKDKKKMKKEEEKEYERWFPTNPKIQMITFTFDDGSVATLRNSGTEMKVKWYVEAKGQVGLASKEESIQSAKKRAKQLKDELINTFIQPQKHGLKVKKKKETKKDDAKK